MNEEKKKISKIKLKISENAINFLLIFILGFLVGITVKTEAKKKVTIGFNDYLVSGMKQQFNLAEPIPSPNQANPGGDSQPESSAPDQEAQPARGQ